MADDTIAVKPARKGMALSHPVTGALRDEGGSWPNDQFTARRLMDGDVKRAKVDTDEAAKPEPQAPVTADNTVLPETVTETAQAAEPGPPASTAPRTAPRR